ncbi:MAG: hypothetical protein V4681_03035 [Patescibacteria group bacterium]
MAKASRLRWYRGFKVREKNKRAREEAKKATTQADLIETVRAQAREADFDEQRRELMLAQELGLNLD